MTLIAADAVHTDSGLCSWLGKASAKLHTLRAAGCVTNVCLSSACLLHRYHYLVPCRDGFLTACSKRVAGVPNRHYQLGEVWAISCGLECLSPGHHLPVDLRHLRLTELKCHCTVRALTLTVFVHAFYHLQGSLCKNVQTVEQFTSISCKYADRCCKHENFELLQISCILLSCAYAVGWLGAAKSSVPHLLSPLCAGKLMAASCQ